MEDEDKLLEKESATEVADTSVEAPPAEQPLPESAIPEPGEESASPETPNESSQWKKWYDFLKENAERSPEFANVIVGMSKGMGFIEALARYVDVENLVPPEGAPDYDGYAAAKAEFQKEKQANEELTIKRESNVQMSVDAFGELISEMGASDEDRDAFIAYLDEVLQDAGDGLLAKKHLMTLWKGFFHEKKMTEKDSEMQDAVRDAEVAGRNQKIEQKWAGKEIGDGLPKLSNTGSASAKAPKKPLIPVRKEFRV